MICLNRLLIVVLVGVAVHARGEEIERNFETTDTPNVTIENKKGSITVIGWDENRVRVTGTVGNDVTRVDIDDDADSPDIDVVSSKWKSENAEAKLTIYVPRGASLDIETVSAPISVSGVSGSSLELQTTSGSIDVDGGFSNTEIEGVSSGIRLVNATGNVSVSNVSGKVYVQGGVNDLEIEVVSGGIEMEIDAQAVQAESVSSSIQFKGHVGDEIQAESVSGSIKYSGTVGPHGELELHVLSGSITVEFDEPAYGDYELSTFSGSIKCDLEPLRNLQRDGKRMEFEFGDGDCSVELESFSGSVSVR